MFKNIIRDKVKIVQGLTFTDTEKGFTYLQMQMLNLFDFELSTIIQQL